MADILIRGMEMPDRRTAELMRTELACVSRECDRHCENCDLVQDVDELIAAFQEVIRILEAVANAVQLPEGHGELIDKQAFIADIAGFIECMSNVGVLVDGETLWGKLLDALANAKTIVPAEGWADNGN